MFFPNDPTPKNTEWHVSEEPRARLGKGIIGQIRYSPDGTQLAVGSSIGIWIYNAHTGKELNLLTGYTKWPGVIAYSPNGQILASGGTDWPELITYSLDGFLYAGTVCLWDPNTGEHKVTLGEHEERVECVEFSPDSSILASGSVDPRGHGTIRLWDVVTGKQKAALKGHTGGYELMVFSPDGETLASADNGRLLGGPMKNVEMIRLWDTETGEHKTTLENPDFRANSIAFSPDGDTIVSGGWDNIDRPRWPFNDTVPLGTVLLWDAATGEHKETLIKERTDSVLTVAYSPNGASLVSGSKDGTILLWDTATYQLKASLTGYPDAIAFSPDSNTLAIATHDKKIGLWDAVSGEHKTTLTEHTDDVYNLIFNPVDGRTFAGIGGDSTIRFWDVATGKHLQTITGHTRSLSSISFNADGSRLAVGSGDKGTSGDKIIRIWNVHSKHLQSTFKVPVARWIEDDVRIFANTISYSPDGKTLASASEDGTIRLWDVESEKPRATTFEGLKGVQTDEPLQEYSIDGFVLAYSPDGKTLASSSRSGPDKDRTIQLWDAVTCKHEATLTTEGHRTILSIAFSPDSRTVAGGDGDGTVYLWDVITGELNTTLTGHTEKYVYSVAFSPDGRTLASGAATGGYFVSGEVYLWDVLSGECKATLDMPNGSSVPSVAFSPDGSALAAGGKGITVWDVHKILYESNDNTHVYATDRFDETGRHKATLKGHTDFVNSVAFSPDGCTLASGGKDGTILLWNIVNTLQTSRQIAEYSIGSTVLVVKNRDVSRSADGNGFFVKRGMIATYTHLWTSPGLFGRRLFGDWIARIVTAKNRVIKETNLNSFALFHNERRDYIDIESIAAIDDQLAILKVSDCEVQPLCLSDEGVKIGDTVYVASTPNTFSQGIISSIFTRHDRKYYQITAQIPDGCNGSPVLNDKGQVIGVAAKNIWIPRHFQHQNNNFVVPSHYLRELLSKVEDSV